jgi:hypothetical protein
MPKHKLHRYIDKVIHGKSFPEVHTAIDLPYIVLGRKHREMFHTPEEAFMMGSIVSQDSRGGFAGLTHVWLDRECSMDKNFQKFVEFMAHQDQLIDKDMRRLKKRTKKGRRKRKR